MALPYSLASETQVNYDWVVICNKLEISTTSTLLLIGLCPSCERKCIKDRLDCPLEFSPLYLPLVDKVVDGRPLFLLSL